MVVIVHGGVVSFFCVIVVDILEVMANFEHKEDQLLLFTALQIEDKLPGEKHLTPALLLSD